MYDGVLIVFLEQPSQPILLLISQLHVFQMDVGMSHEKGAALLIIVLLLMLVVRVS